MTEDYKTEADVLKEMTDIITAPTKTQDWLNSPEVNKFCEEVRKGRENNESS